MTTNQFSNKGNGIMLHGLENLRNRITIHQLKAVENFITGKQLLLFAIGICFSFMLNAQVSKSVDINTGGISSVLTATELTNDINSVIAEDYHPFLNNSTWFCANQNFEGYINSVFTTEKDTAFNGFTYSKIIEKHVFIKGVPNNEITMGGGQIVYFVREDIPNKKVYQYFRGTGDCLLYDFALEVGAFLPGNSEYELKTVDLVEGPDGSRKRFIFKSNKYDEQTIWIEGIGNISSPFIPYIAIRDWQKLICASQNGTRTYEFVNKDGITCDSFNPTSAITEIDRELSVSIYPNPTDGNIKLIFNQVPEMGSYVIVNDVTGKTILKQPIQSKEEWIDLQGNTPGVYFIKTNLKDIKVQKVLLK